MFGGHFRFDAPPATPITSDDDFAFNVDIPFRKNFVVSGSAVVHVDQLACHVTVLGIGVVGRQLFSREIRGGIFLQ